MGRQISKYDIARFAHRVTVDGKFVESKKKDKVKRRLKIPSVYQYLIDGTVATRIEYYFIGNEKKIHEIEKVPLDEIYQGIKNVYDGRNILIARRIKPRSRLEITGKGMSKFILKA